MIGRSRKNRSRRSRRSLVATRFDLQRAPFWVFVGFVVLCALSGGSARADIASLFVLRPGAVFALGALLFLPTIAIDWRAIRAPLWFLAALALAIALQLVPLPPAIWAALSGHARYAEATAIAGLAQPWRPVSLTPDATVNSLVALLPIAVTVLAFGAMRREDRHLLAPLIVALACASAVLGIAQITGSAYGPLYLYRITHFGFPVGLLANRNHEAALLAITLPVLRAWTLLPASSPDAARTRSGVALGIGLALVPMLLVTGSRAGLVLGAVGLAATLVPLPELAGIPRRRRRTWIVGGAALIVSLAVFAAVLVGRATALERLLSPQGYQNELRIEQTPLLLHLMREFLPFGSGFGSFDPVFRGFESNALLRPTYFNHAHNDLIELVMTGGLPAVLVLVAFACWWARRAIRAFREPLTRAGIVLARAGAVVIAMLFGASLVDYPLRTPLIGVVFAVACCWLGASDKTTGETGPYRSSGRVAPRRDGG